MAIIEELQATSWSELSELINDTFADWPDFIFRGQAQSVWKLESTLSRTINKLKYSNKEELMQDHLTRFVSSIRGRRGLNPKKLNENELWALGQHYGLYTPLLDWTRAPWVAVFFAIVGVDSSYEGDMTLWALYTPDIQRLNDYYKKEKRNSENWQVELLEPELDENSRLIGQRGVLTKLGINNDIETWVKNAEVDDEWVTLYKINFPSSINDRALAYLDLMNINHSSLFPDLVGASLDTNTRLEQTDYIIENQDNLWKQE